MSQYETDAQNLVDHLKNVAPLGELWSGISVYRVNVTSTDSGADNPHCSDGTGDGTTVATYFDATFCSDGKIQRLLAVNDDTAKSVATAQVPNWKMIFVIVNSPIYGGSGKNQVAVFSTHPQAFEIAAHEMGHSAFGLADEYDAYYPCNSTQNDPAYNSYAGGPLSQPNITNDTTQTTLKWKDLVLSWTPWPSSSNGDCTKCPSQTNPLPDGTVGAFVGAFYYHCGVYRPQFNCRMRILGQPFCAVCQAAIRAKLASYVTGSGKKCFIATAAMGSDVHPHVQLLRAFRDDVLLESGYAEVFERLLRVYYRLSPPIANAMMRNAKLKLALRYLLVYPLVFAIKLAVPLWDNLLRITSDATRRKKGEAEV